VKFRACVLVSLVLAFSCQAQVQDVLLSTDFVLKAGTSESRTLTVNPPEQQAQLVMIGFNPVKALAVDCRLRLYTTSDRLLGSYDCAQRQIYPLKQSLAGVSQFKAWIEVSNHNFTAASTSFSVTNRFQFATKAP